MIWADFIAAAERRATAIISNRRWPPIKPMLVLARSGVAASMPGIVKSWNDMTIKIIAKSSAASLNLLKVKALNADLRVPTLVAQKLISKNEVRPISSQPKSSTSILPDITRVSMLQTKELSIMIRRSTLGSYLKYTKA